MPKICGEEFGHMVLLAAFDCVDDTKLLAKAVIGEMLGVEKDSSTKNLCEIFASEKAGRKVLMYLLGMYCLLLVMHIWLFNGRSDIYTTHSMFHLYFIYSRKRYYVFQSRLFGSFKTRRRKRVHQKGRWYSPQGTCSNC